MIMNGLETAIFWGGIAIATAFYIAWRKYKEEFVTLLLGALAAAAIVGTGLSCLYGAVALLHFLWRIT
jgi:hypothetical protein